jgi:hypothetical protein
MPRTVMLMTKDYAFDFMLPTIVPQETEHRADFAGVHVIYRRVALQANMMITIPWRIEFAWRLTTTCRDD